MLLPLIFATALLGADCTQPSDGQPNRQPQPAVADQQIAMTYGSGIAIYFTGSSDAGKTLGSRFWCPRVNDVDYSARDLLHIIATGAKNSVLATWLDLRQHGTKLYGSTSTYGGLTWSATRLVHESQSVCGCTRRLRRPTPEFAGRQLRHVFGAVLR